MNPEAPEDVPKVSLGLSLEPTTHSYSSTTAPKLILSLTSHAPRPLTIYNDAIRPGRLVAEGKFSIFDVTSNVFVQQMKTRFCMFEPPSKVHVPLREDMFYTLYPEIPVTLETSFGRNIRAPKPRSDPEFGSINPRRDDIQARGVDGLEIGHQYRLGINGGWGAIAWWEWGEKEEVINPPEGKLDGRKVVYHDRKRSRKTPHEPILVDKKGVEEVEFCCTE